jgi:hypothetical protein
MRKHQTPIPFSAHAHPNEARASVENKQKGGYRFLCFFALGAAAGFAVTEYGNVASCRNLAVLLLAVTTAGSAF